MSNSDYAVDRQRWARMTIFDQMGNVYAEVGRTLQAKKSGDEVKFKAALTRALDLLDATIEVLIARTPHRAKEILRAKDQFLQLLFGPKPTAEEERGLENYFLQYAVAARLQR